MCRILGKKIFKEPFHVYARDLIKLSENFLSEEFEKFACGMDKIFYRPMFIILALLSEF